ncbi:MAG: hypothetical protein KGD64_07370 [Candidatus Heimdallarchaeota archaeon]|nr:hypothetical protein [Candidatus Heimdallarchaeota archaeon]
MTSDKMKPLTQSVWLSIKPLFLFLLTVAIMITIALIPMAFVWGFDLQDTAFLVLVIFDLAVIVIFATGFLGIAVRYLMKDFAKREDRFCNFCGEDLPDGNICLNCGKDNRLTSN